MPLSLFSSKNRAPLPAPTPPRFNSVTLRDDGWTEATLPSVSVHRPPATIFLPPGSRPSSVDLQNYRYQEIDGMRGCTGINADPDREKKSHVDFIAFPQPLPPAEGLTRLYQAACHTGGQKEGYFRLRYPGRLPAMAAAMKTCAALRNVEITSFLGEGEHSVVFATPDDQVLKLSLGPNFSRPHCSQFDADIHARGTLSIPEGTPIPEKDQKRALRGVSWYLQQRGDRNGLTPDHVKEVIRKIRANGHKTRDIQPDRVDQVALFEGNTPLLTDPECAVPLSGFYLPSRWYGNRRHR